MYLSGAQVQPTTHIIPEGTESVNGSNVTGGCQAAVSDQRLCGTIFSGTISYLVDDNIPVLNTAAPNWASQLVTVRKNSPTVAIPYDHVLLIFDYSSRVSLILVELNLFYCPEWNIGAPNITVYLDEDDTYFINYIEGAPDIAVRGNIVLSSQSSCDSLLPVRIPLENTATQHHTWYIVVSFDPQPEIEWVHIGEVTLFDTEPPPLPVPSELHYVSTHYNNVCFHNGQPQAGLGTCILFGNFFGNNRPFYVKRNFRSHINEHASFTTSPCSPSFVMANLNDCEDSREGSSGSSACMLLADATGVIRT